MILAAKRTCFGVRRRHSAAPPHSESSSPTGLFTTHGGGHRRDGQLIAPGASTDQTIYAPNKSVAVRFICSTSSGCAPFRPAGRTPSGTHSGGFTMPRFQEE